MELNYCIGGENGDLMSILERTEEKEIKKEARGNPASESRLDLVKILASSQHCQVRVGRDLTQSRWLSGNRHTVQREGQRS